METNLIIRRGACLLASAITLSIAVPGISQAGVSSVSSVLRGNITIGGALDGSYETFDYRYPSDIASQSNTINPLTMSAAGTVSGLYDNYAGDQSGSLFGSFSGNATFATPAAGQVNLSYALLADDVASGAFNLGNDNGNSGFTYRFATDQTGSIDISWTTTGSAYIYWPTNPCSYCLQKWMVRVDDTYLFTDKVGTGIFTVQLPTAGVHEFELRNGANVGGGLLDADWQASGTFNFAISAAAPVPEPETYAMLLAGLGLLGLAARRRKQRAA